MNPVAEPDKLMAVPGEEVAAVLPLNLLLPAAMLAVRETSFHVWLPGICILVKFPVTWPEPKFTEKEALPST